MGGVVQTISRLKPRVTHGRVRLRHVKDGRGLARVVDDVVVDVIVVDDVGDVATAGGLPLDALLTWVLVGLPS